MAIWSILRSFGIHILWLFGTFCVHLVYFMVFGTFCVHLVYFMGFGTFCGHLVYFMVIWYILWSFGIVYGYLVYAFPFWHAVPRQIWQPLLLLVRHLVDWDELSPVIKSS
jgi:hypothetical protein